MNGLSVVPSPIPVKPKDTLAAKDIENRRYFIGGHLLLENSLLYYIIANSSSLSPLELRVFMALKASSFNGTVFADRVYALLDRHRVYPAKLKSIKGKFIALLKDVKGDPAFRNFPVKLPREIVKSLARDGTKLEMLLFLFGCSKQCCRNRMTFTLPQGFLARKFNATRCGVQKAIKRLAKKGMLVPILTPAKELGEQGQRYSWYSSNYLPELRRYRVRKNMRVVSPSPAAPSEPPELSGRLGACSP